MGCYITICLYDSFYERHRAENCLRILEQQSIQGRLLGSRVWRIPVRSSPSVGHFAIDLICRQSEAPSHQDAMFSEEYRLPTFPRSPGPLVHAKLLGRFNDGPAHRPPFGKEAFRNALRFRKGVVAQEPKDGGYGLHRWVGLAFFPM